MSDIRDYLVSMREHFASYHDHKEQMAFGATGLYIAGVTALLVQENLKWMKTLPPWLPLSTAVVMGALGFLFVRWQLGMREYASDMVDACNVLLSRWLAAVPSDILVDTVSHRGRLMPQFLADELKSLSASRTWFHGPVVSRYLTYATIVVWSVLLLLRIMDLWL